MQTFLPYPNIEKSMKSLDSRRLGKQRVEAFQILNIILGRTKSKGWRNHPAVKMWAKNPNALKLYLNEAIKEWVRRGYNNTMKFENIRGKVVFPGWFRKRSFHSSHRSNLLRKNPEHYSQFGWSENPDKPYVWPV
jgi:hypothetical protein